MARDDIRTYEKIACEINGVTEEDLFRINAKGGGDNLPITRFMCIWFAVHVLKENYKTASKRFGLHRTTYYHAKKTIEGYVDVDPNFREIFDYFLKASKKYVNEELSEKTQNEIMQVKQRGEHIGMIRDAITNLFQLQKALYDYIEFNDVDKEVLKHAEKCEESLKTVKTFFSE